MEKPSHGDTHGFWYKKNNVYPWQTGSATSYKKQASLNRWQKGKTDPEGPPIKEPSPATLEEIKTTSTWEY